MCGIVGWLGDGTSRFDAERLEVMVDRLTARGPDGRGVWWSSLDRVALGHRRLAVLDVSDAGAQPMTSACGRFVISYNGEVYNHLRLRRRLEHEGHAPPGGWLGHSDTETLLVAVAAWGVAATLKAATGMFAIALWDEANGTLHLARDRFGEKPLYVARLRSGIAFASELKALLVCPDLDRTVSATALQGFLQHGYVSAPGTIFRSVTKLLPGTHLTLTTDQVKRLASSGDFLEPHRSPFWRLHDVVTAGAAEPFAGSLDEATDELDRVLGDAVEGQMLSDVPLGAFLSGGIDSTAIVALMQARSARPVRTFTIGFEEQGYDESPYAAAIARHLGTDHTQVLLTYRDALDRVPLLPTIWDEPYADVSQIPTRLVSEVARRDVTVALSGDGGDELFAGYDRYGWTERVWRASSWAPAPLRRAVGTSVRRVPVETWDRVARFLPVVRRMTRPGDRAHKTAWLLEAASPGDVYARMTSVWKRPDALLLEPAAPGMSWAEMPHVATMLEAMMYRDAVDYLPDDIMVKVDRAAMSVSLETRAPLLDHEVAAFAWRIPVTMKRRDGRSKLVVRHLLDRYVPRSLIDRPKAGFSVPIAAWLRGALRPWAEALLTRDRLERAGLAHAPIARAWAAHVKGTELNHYVLWHVLMYLAWSDAHR